MRRRGLLTTTTMILMSAALAVPATAAALSGVWMRGDGEAKVQFAPCGGETCGTIVWLKRPNGPAQIGEQVFFGMASNGGNHWSGRAHNPEDGKDYEGTMTMSGNHLSTQGCAMGGMICKTSFWVRSR